MPRKKELKHTRRWRRLSGGSACVLLLLFLVAAPWSVLAQGETVIAEHPLGTLTLEELRIAADRIPRNEEELRALVVQQALVDYGLVLARKEGLEQSPLFLEILKEKRARALAELFVRERIEKPAAPTPEEIETALGVLSPQPYVLQIVTPTQEEAEEARERIASGEDFRSVAAEASVGFLSGRGGIVGYLKSGSGRYSQEEEALLMSMKAGEMSDVMEGPLGYSLFYVEHIKGVEKIREELLPGIKRSLYQKKRALLEREILQELRRRYEVRLNEEFITGEKSGDLLPLDTVVARVGEEPVTLEEVFFDEKIFHKGVPPRPELRARAVNTYLTDVLYRKEGERLELDQTPEFSDTLERIRRSALWDLYVDSVVTPPRAGNVDIRIREDALSKLLATP